MKKADRQALSQLIREGRQERKKQMEAQAGEEAERAAQKADRRAAQVLAALAVLPPYLHQYVMGEVPGGNETLVEVVVPGQTRFAVRVTQIYEENKWTWKANGYAVVVPAVPGRWTYWAPDNPAKMGSYAGEAFDLAQFELAVGAGTEMVAKWAEAEAELERFNAEKAQEWADREAQAKREADWQARLNVPVAFADETRKALDLAGRMVNKENGGVTYGDRVAMAAAQATYANACATAWLASLLAYQGPRSGGPHDYD